MYTFSLTFTTTDKLRHILELSEIAHIRQFIQPVRFLFSSPFGLAVLLRNEL